MRTTAGCGFSRAHRGAFDCRPAAGMGTGVGVEVESGVGVFVEVGITVFVGSGVAVGAGMATEQETRSSVSTMRVICFRPTIAFPSRYQCQTFT